MNYLLKNKLNLKIFTKEELKMMKSTAILINTSRGEIINEPDLVEALRTDYMG